MSEKYIETIAVKIRGMSIQLRNKGEFDENIIRQLSKSNNREIIKDELEKIK